jgi:hypothetical protein
MPSKAKWEANYTFVRLQKCTQTYPRDVEAEETMQDSWDFTLYGAGGDHREPLDFCHKQH